MKESTGVHVAAGERWARDVISGKAPASKWTRLACERHFEDKKRARSKAWPYRFDAEIAERVCRFLQLLPHIKGRWARKDPKRPNAHRIKLGAWQCFAILSLFGWVKKRGGKRRFLKGSIYLPRKNGKSTLAAGIGHWMAWKDGEPGAEVYSGATTEKQAWEVFGPARLMAKGEPDMAEGLGITIGAQNMFRLDDGSKFEPVIGKPGDGSSPHCSITDEYHEHATSEQYDTMLTGMGAREQPLALIISTAGDNLAGPCYDDWLTVKKIMERVIEDDTHFGLIFTVDDDDDWTSEHALRKANPNYDVSVGAEFLQQMQRDAINNARKQGTFKTKHLNVWVQARDAYINMQRWADCEQPGLTLESLGRRPCYIGMDLASKVDLAAIELLFPLEGGQYARFGKYYLPSETVEAPENQHYRAWAQEGWLTVTEGNIIDFTRILEDIEALQSQVQIVELAYDPAQATMLVTELQNAGVTCVELRPTVLNYSEPMKQVEALIRDRKLKHNGDPVMRWAMSNVVAKSDAKDNVYPRKERPENKIDPFVALCAAMARGMTADPGSFDDMLRDPLVA
jgi:phage terminase large subunit-like protein